MGRYGGFTFVQAHQHSNKAAILLAQRADDTEVKGGCFAKAKLVIETATTAPHTADSSITGGRQVWL